MGYATKHIATTLRAARESKGLSQRELSTKSGVPQGHISKIENGAVDLRLSSLVELARVLDLELTLVPRKTMPAVRSIVRSSERSTPQDGKAANRALKELARLQNTISHLPTELLSKNKLEQFQRQARELQRFQLALPDIEGIRAAHKTLEAFKNNTENLSAVHKSLSQLQKLRNALAHGKVDAGGLESSRPAYSLDEDDHG